VIRSSVLVIVLLTLTACSHLTARDMAIADTVSTEIALNVGAQELNPLGFPATIIGKILVINWIQQLERCEDQQQIDHWAAMLWGSATANNLLIPLEIWSPGLGAIVIVITALIIYQARLELDRNACE
jgi:hypothetical protein